MNSDTRKHVHGIAMGTGTWIQKMLKKKVLVELVYVHKKYNL